MTDVVLDREFRVAPEGHTTLVLPKGTTVSGHVADLAIQTGHAKRPPRAPRNIKPAAPNEVK